MIDTTGERREQMVNFTPNSVLMNIFRSNKTLPVLSSSNSVTLHEYCYYKSLYGIILRFSLPMTGRPCQNPRNHAETITTKTLESKSHCHSFLLNPNPKTLQTHTHTHSHISLNTQNHIQISYSTNRTVQANKGRVREIY